MKKIFMWIAGFLFVAAFYFFWPGENVTVTIPEGSSASQVAAQLREERVIRSSVWFKVVLKLTGTGKKIKPGEYTLRKNMSAEEALWRLVRSGGKNYIKVVIPEGWRAEQIADRMEANGITGKDSFLKIVLSRKLEGYLFPATYHLERAMDASKVISMMQGEFERQITPLLKSSPGTFLREREILTIASIVEREAVVLTEKPLIAAVYLNRIKKRMPLEADPTVQYALGYWKKGLTLKDLKIKSPYNTYGNSGLPPGPICNPGYESVRAVLNPADVDALYFVADRKGQHVFNSSFEEHKKAKRRIEKENGGR